MMAFTQDWNAAIQRAYFSISQHRVIESILADVEQQEVATIVSKPVVEEQTLVSQIFHGHSNNPDVDRQELGELRKFLKQPLVGAAVQQLRKALRT